MKKLFTLFFGFLLFSIFTAEGLAAQSPTSSADEYALIFFKKFNSTQKKLTYMNKSGSLEKVGTETVNGNISGTIFYDVKIKGFGADVTLRYTNYCDEEGWVFDGEIITHSNMAQNGTFEGSIKISGINPGEVTYDKVLLKKGQPGGGNYLVTTPGFSNAQVEYTVYLKSKEE